MSARRIHPNAWFLLLVAPVVTGCHASGLSNHAARPEPSLPKISMTATEAINRHNANASKVQTLLASPRITVSSRETNGSLGGLMALERPRNFKLKMLTQMKTVVADIGSNDDEFWFWTKGDKRDNAVYVCSYVDLPKTPISAAFQPDWVVEAMGLKSIDPAKVTSKPGATYGAIELVSTLKSPSGESLTKKTIIDASGRIKEHMLYQGKEETLLAYAVISEYQDYPDSTSTSGEPVFLPSRFRLKWLPEGLALDVTLSSVKLNQPITDDQRQERFSEPRPAGTKRLNLADLAPQQPPSSSASARPARDREPRTNGSTQTRSSRPIPPSEETSAVRLGRPIPEPLGVEGASRGPLDPIALAPDLSDNPTPRAIDQVVRPGIPRPGEP